MEEECIKEIRAKKVVLTPFAFLRLLHSDDGEGAFGN
jgi:hypothetical protein